MALIDTSVSRRFGILLVLGSVIGWSLAGVFTKGVDANAWSVVFSRSVFAGPLVFAYVLAKNGMREVTSFGRLGVVGWTAATVSTLSTLAFLTSFKHTAIANVAIIYAAVPFAAAAIAWAFTGVRTSGAVLLLSALAMTGVAIMIHGGLGIGNLYGDNLAVLMMIGMAVYLVMVRQYPDAPMIAAQTASSLQMIIVAWIMTDPMTVPMHEIGWLALFGLAHASAVIMLTEGARLIPAAEAGFIGGLEAPLAPVFAWLILSELPPSTTFVGGAIVLTAVGLHVGREFRG